MGRMADVWKSADRGPATPLPVPGALLTLETAPAPGPELADDDDVPFIEVGGPRPIMKHLEPIAPKKESVALPRPAALLANRGANDDAVMNIRFESVRAGRIPGRGFGPEFIAFHQPEHAVSVQYRSLVAEIITQLPGNKPRGLLIVSAKPGVGASTVVMNLGVTVARQDSIRITVVDAHFARPDLSARLGIPPSPGLRDVLARHMPLAWSIQETAQPNLFALPVGRDEAPPAEALVPIIEQLRSRTDWIVVDAGPWDDRLLPVAEACDAVYLVHADGDPSARDLVAGILAETGRLRGCIVTRR